MQEWIIVKDRNGCMTLALDLVRKETYNLDSLWGVLLHDIGKAKCATIIDGIIKHTQHASIGAEMAVEIMNRFKSSSDHRDMVVGIVKDHMRIKHSDKMKRSTLRRLIVEPHFEQLTLVSWADSKVSIPASKEDGKNKFDWFIRLNSLIEDLKDEVSLPEPFVKGKDLIIMGLTPSKDFGTILKQVMDLQLDGIIETREEALEVLKEIISERKKNLQ